jgi:hypothetical protein
MNHGEFDLILQVRRSRLVVYMLACILLLMLLSLAANVMWIERWPASGMALALFSSDREMTITTWWSALVLAGLGVLTWLVSYRHSGGWMARLPWWTLAAGFLFLSADEACMLHERLGGKIKLEGTLHHARWAVLWVPPALLITGVVMWRLWRSYRYLVVGLMLGIVIYLGGAVGIETINAVNRYKVEQKLQLPTKMTVDANQSFVPIEWRRDRAYYPYVFGTTIEELMEMLAPLIWLWVLLDKRSTVGPSVANGGPGQPQAEGPA